MQSFRRKEEEDNDQHVMGPLRSNLQDYRDLPKFVFDGSKLFGGKKTLRQKKTRGRMLMP